MKGKKVTWPRRLCWWAAAAVLLLGMTAVAARYWILPETLRGRVRKACLRHWEGSLLIGRVDFALLGRTDDCVRLRDVQLLDRQDRLCASARTVKLTFNRFPAMHPILTEVSADGVELRLHRLDGRLILPIRRAQGPSTGLSADLQSIDIPDVSFTIYDDGAAGLRIEPLRFTVSRGPTFYAIKLQTAPQCPQTISFIGQLPLEAPGPALEALRGRGLVMLRDVNARQDPATSELFAFLQSAVDEIAPRSNVQAVFSVQGGVVNFRRAVLADKLIVMQVEEGGTVDLSTRELDLYLITLQLRGLSNLLGQIPLVKLATTLTNKLTRVHVGGTWDAKEFRKEPVEDLSAATLEMLQDAIRTGGLLVPSVSGGVGRLFDAFGARGAESTPSRTRPAADR